MGKIKYILLIVFSLVCIIFVHNDYFLYKRPILKVSKIETKIDDEEYDEKYYTQYITGVIKNGKYKGKTYKTVNYYSGSLVYDDKLNSSSEVFVEISNDGKTILGIDDVKRDNYLALLIVIFIDLILLIAGKKGVQTLISFFLNVAITAGAILIYIHHSKSINVIALYMIVSLIFIVASLFITNGKGKKTFAAIVSSIISLLLSFGLSCLIIKLHEDGLYIWTIDYIEAVSDYYGYLYISVLLSGLGAIMDVSITIASSLNELITKNPKIDKKSLFKSGRIISQDIVGTMINVMLFTCYTSIIPTILLVVKNNMTLIEALDLYGSLELSIVLCTCISIILTIPVSLYTSIVILSRKKVIEHE